MSLNNTQLEHLYQGECPDVTNDYAARDENCFVCNLLMEFEQKPKFLYHATTERKAKKYRESGYIKTPVRGFNTLKAAMWWAMKVNRNIVYKVEVYNTNKLPEHHNPFGEAWWNDGDIPMYDAECIVSATQNNDFNKEVLDNDYRHTP